MSPACQKILSSSITGNPVILPKRLARVDLPEAPRPRMTTRFMALVYCDGRRRVLAATSPVTRQSSSYPANSGPGGGANGSFLRA